MTKWPIFKGNTEPHDGIRNLPEPPPWRNFESKEDIEQAELSITTAQENAYRRRFGQAVYQASGKEVNLVNTALYLRRPLLVTGKPGTGKSSLAHAVAFELKLGPVLVWPITSRSTVRNALYEYDAVGRLQASQFQDTHNKPQSIGDYLRLGPLGTALLPRDIPRVLLIDEIDKSDIDLPNDLLNLFEEGEYSIPELARHPETKQGISVLKSDDGKVTIKDGYVSCHAFPFVVITSNGERELPAAFLRRCLRLDIEPPDKKKLTDIVTQHFRKMSSKDAERRLALLDTFLAKRERGDLATDQLLNAIYLMVQGIDLESELSTQERLLDVIFRYLTEEG